jgi:hypothetical protein
VRPLQPGRDGVISVYVMPSGRRCRVAACASCGEPRVIRRRGLCSTCRHRHTADGTIGDYGWTRADRLAEYAAGRRDGLGVGQAAARAGVSRATGSAYEAALRRLPGAA